MKKLMNTVASYGAFAARPMFPGAPQIMFAPETGAGSGASADGANEGAGSDEGAEDGNAGAGADDAAAVAAAAAAAAAAAEKDAKDSKDGKTDDEKAGLLREVMEKKSTIKELKDQLKAFEGIDPAAVRALIEEKRQAELAAEEAKGNFDRVKQMIVEAHESEKKSLSDTIADLQAQIAARDSELDKLTIGQSFALSSFIGDELTLTPSKAKLVYGSYFERVDGKTVGYDKPAGASDRTMLVGANGEPLSFEDAMRKIVDADPEKDKLLKTKVAPGAGSSSKKVDPTAGKQEPAKKVFGVSRIELGLSAGK